LIFQHHDGKTYYHFVDSPEFMYAIDSDRSVPHSPQKLFTAKELASTPYIHGTDFNADKVCCGGGKSTSSICEIDPSQAYLANAGNIGTKCSCGCKKGTFVAQWNSLVGSCPVTLGCGDQ
jgi:hypothetical protein